MSEEWQYQLRIDLDDERAALARQSMSDPALAPLGDILERHKASAISQYDAFAAYVAEAEREGPEGYHLYEWTKATIENPAKKEKYLKSFTLYVEGEEVYDGDKAEALERELQPLLDDKLIARLKKYDTNPANNPHPPKPQEG